MKKKNLFCLLATGIMCASVSAAPVDGKSWAKVNYSNLPSHGGTTYRTDVQSKKSDSSSYGSMKAGYSAVLKAYARFIDTSKFDQSNAVGLNNNTVVHPTLYSTSRDPGNIVATKASSNALEPGRIEVSLKFSANNLK